MSKGARRNQLCECGSGRKQKNCCDGRKPREIGISFEMAEPTIVKRVVIDGDQVRLMSPSGHRVTPREGYIESWYNRGTKRKILTRAPLRSHESHLDIHALLLEHELLFAVDTNTKKTASGLVLSTPVLVKGSVDSDRRAVYEPVLGVELGDVAESPERVGWHEAIERILENEKPGVKVALVVDSDLDQLLEYSERRRPITPGFFVPETFRLIFATADAGAENLQNLMISCADAEAKGLCRAAERLGPPKERANNGAMPYAYRRHWYASEPEGWIPAFPENAR